MIASPWSTQLSPLASQHHLSEYSRIKHGYQGRPLPHTSHRRPHLPQALPFTTSPCPCTYHTSSVSSENARSSMQTRSCGGPVPRNHATRPPSSLPPRSTHSYSNKYWTRCRNPFPSRRPHPYEGSKPLKHIQSSGYALAVPNVLTTPFSVYRQLYPPNHSSQFHLI